MPNSFSGVPANSSGRCESRWPWRPIQPFSLLVKIIDKVNEFSCWVRCVFSRDRSWSQMTEKDSGKKKAGTASGFFQCCIQPLVLRVQYHLQVIVALDEARLYSARLLQNFDVFETFHNFFPDCAQLHLSQTVAHATMQTKTE